MPNLNKDRTLPARGCTREDIYDLCENLDPTAEMVDTDFLTVVGGKITLANNPPRWSKFTFSNTDLEAAATTNTVALLTLPAGAVVHAVKAKHSAAFTGGTLSAYTVSVGTTGTPNQFIDAFNVFQAPGDTVDDHDATVTFLTGAVAGTDLVVKADSVDDDLDGATQGSVDVWVLWSVAV